MSLNPLNSEPSSHRYPVLNLGFRPFFLVAGVFAVVTIGLWLLVYRFAYQLPIENISTYQWHAHEMIYGYAMAVIAGFLLTATKNWTGLQTLHGWPLLGLVCLWFAARIFITLGYTLFAAASDMLFIIALAVAVSLPIVKVRQWRQLLILIKLFALCGFNLLFYLGALGWVGQGVHLGVYGGFYLVIGLILVMGRRVIPFFIERGVGGETKLFNSKLLDIASLILFVAFFVCEMFQVHTLATRYSALLLGLVNLVRIFGWHTGQLWKKPLLWSLYLAMLSIAVGFVLYFVSYEFGLSKFIAIHALAYGGIGTVTLSMMARVSLGHTGRNIHQPPKNLLLALGLLILGALFRILAPIVLPLHYGLWISAAMICWVLAFSLFVLSYSSILLRQRVDGRFG